MTSHKPMHVVLLPSTFPRDDTDPRGIFYRDHAEMLQESGAKVTVVAPIIHHLNGLPCWPHQMKKSSERTSTGLCVHKEEFVGWIPKVPYGNMQLWIRKADKLFEEYIQSNGLPDVVHAHCSIYAGYVASLWKRKYDIPYVLTEHSSAFERNLISNWKKCLAKKAFRDADKLIAVSQTQADCLNQNYSTSSEWSVIPNPLSNVFATTPLIHHKKQEGNFKFLSVGLLKKVKGHDLLLRAFSASFKNCHSVKLSIVGSGPEYKNLKKLSSDLDIDKQVSFLGNLSRVDVLHEMDSANSFVLSSHYETFGVVIIEALARGLPVISTKSGGPNDNVPENCGYLIPCGNLHSLQQAMKRLRNQYHQFDPIAIKEYAVRRFGPEVVGKELYNTLSNVLNIPCQK